MSVYCYSIWGEFIMFDDRLTRGYLFIKGDRIKRLYEDSALFSHKIEKKLHKYPLYKSYDNALLMVSGIDLSVSMNAGFESAWDRTEEFSRLALLGGTCAILNKPFCYRVRNQSESVEEYQLQMYRHQVEVLQKKCCIDYSQSTYVDESTVNNVQTLRNEGCFAFNMFLQRTIQNDIGYITNSVVGSSIIDSLEGTDALLIVHLQSNTDKDLSITSPFRHQPIYNRLEEQLIGRRQSADGIQGDIQSDESQESDGGTPESAIKLTVSQFNLNSDNLQQDTDSEISDERFLKTSKRVAKKKQHQLLAHAELKSYEKDQNKSPENSSGNSANNSYRFPYSVPNSTENNDVNLEEQKLWVEGSETIKLRTRSLSGLLSRRQQKNTVNEFQLSLMKVETQFSSKLMLSTEEDAEEPKSNKSIQNSKNRDYFCFLAFRPDLWEREAVRFMYQAIRNSAHKNPVILLSEFSSALALGEILKLKNKFPTKTKIFTQLSYPHVIFDSDIVHEGATIFKSDPPLRSKANKRLLQMALDSHRVQCVSSSHFYVDPLLKQVDGNNQNIYIQKGDFRRAMGGLTTIGVQIQATWTALWSSANRHQQVYNGHCRKVLFDGNQDLFEGNQDAKLRKKIITKLFKLQSLVASEPAECIGVQNRYGKLGDGMLANFIVWDPFTLTTQPSHDPLHIFNNKILLGQICDVYFRGVHVTKITPQGHRIR